MYRHFYRLTLLACVGLLISQLSRADTPVFDAQIEREFPTFDARQGVAVDASHFYAVNNFSLTKHDKQTGEALLQWDGLSDVDGPLVHLDSGFVLDGRLYAAHSNYPVWPMTSSIEIWDTETLVHVASHSFGIALGSMTWLDRHNGYWWGAFANYDKTQDEQSHPYGETRNTQVVKMNDEFVVLERWTLPPSILSRMTPMSNSGGSWGPDGYLYLTGHDFPEIYVMALPATGSQLDWVATVTVPGLDGQGIAWDRSVPEPILWAILKREELVYRIRMPAITVPAASRSYVRKPGEFETNR